MSAKILLIEPDRRLGRIYQLSLKKAGFKVEHRSSAESAIKILDEKPMTDLIIMEPQLIGHGGIEFLYELRSYRDWQSVPVIINSLIPLETLQSMQVGLEQLGVVERFYKPQTSLNRLIEACQQALSLTKTPR